MINIPDQPVRFAEVGDDDPLVVEALRPRKPYERCWCGSGRKFKQCHRFREEQQPLPMGQILNEQNEVFWKIRTCMHPLATPTSCQGPVIDAHTIQRKGPLQKIVSDTNHVLQFRASDGEIAAEDVGWKKASTFPGYCSLHDSQTFGALERVQFSGTHEQCILQTYRNVCNELYKKRAAIEVLKYQRMVIDRGCDLHTQISRQLSVARNIAGQTKSMEELTAIWRAFDNVVARGQFERFMSKCYFFDGALDVTSAAALHIEFDFQGRQLADMWDLKIDAEMLAHSIMATERGGAIVLTWAAEAKSPAAIVSSFDAITDEDKGDIFVQYCFLNSENTFFSRAWWEGLDDSHRQRLKQYAGSLHYEGGAFVANDPRLVNWIFTHERAAAAAAE